LHTNDAVGAVTRLLDMGIEPFLLSSTLLGVMAQRLVRRLCPECRTAGPASAVQRLELPPHLRDAPIHRAAGCPACKGTGYRGRTGIYEMLIVDSECADLIRGGASEQLLRDYNARHGVVTLRADGMRWISSGETTLDEVLRVTRATVDPEA
jgi:general secretion pathway protein E